MGKRPLRKRKVEKAEVGNLTIFGFDINELIKNLSGHSLQEIAQNPELAKEIREKVEKEHPQTQSFEKKFGNISVSYQVNKRNIGNGIQPKTTQPKTVQPKITFKAEDLKQELEAQKKKDKEWKKEERKKQKEQ